MRKKYKATGDHGDDLGANKSNSYKTRKTRKTRRKATMKTSTTAAAITRFSY